MVSLSINKKTPVIKLIYKILAPIQIPVIKLTDKIITPIQVTNEALIQFHMCIHCVIYVYYQFHEGKVSPVSTTKKTHRPEQKIKLTVLMVFPSCSTVRIFCISGHKNNYYLILMSK